MKLILLLFIFFIYLLNDNLDTPKYLFSHFLINRINIILRCKFFGCIHDLLYERNIILSKIVCNLLS